MKGDSEYNKAVALWTIVLGSIYMGIHALVMYLGLLDGLSDGLQILFALPFVGVFGIVGGMILFIALCYLGIIKSDAIIEECSFKKHNTHCSLNLGIPCNTDNCIMYQTYRRGQ